IDQVVPLTSRIRTLLDLGSVLQPEALTVIGDHLVRRPRPRFEGRTQPFATIEQLQAAAEEHTGRGVRAVRAAMKMVRMSSDSPAETRLRLAFLRAGLPEPVANSRLRVADAPGDGLIDLGEPDLQWPQWRVVLEHEGPSHLRPEQLSRDIERTERRRDGGWLGVRTTARTCAMNADRRSCGLALRWPAADGEGDGLGSRLSSLKRARSLSSSLKRAGRGSWGGRWWLAFRMWSSRGNSGGIRP